MKLTLNDLKPKSKEIELTETIKHGDFELTLCVKHDDDFNKALEQVHTMLQTPKKLTKNSLSRAGIQMLRDSLSDYEAMLFVIGEYCVKSWNIKDENDEPLMPNGENFNKVMEYFLSTDNGTELLTTTIGTFNKLLADYKTKISDIRKK